MARAIAYRLFVAWDGTNYTNESARLIQATGENRLTDPNQIASGRGIVDRCTLQLDNRDGRFSPLNTSGALYSHIQAGGAYHRPMYLEVSINGGTNYSRVFTGVIKLPQERAATPTQGAIVALDCRSVDEKLLGRRMSTSVYDMQGVAASGQAEGGIVTNWLSLAGASATVDAGVFRVPYAWLDDESVLEELWNLASACGGRFYADPDGALRYEDATHWLKAPHTTSQETITRADFGSLEPVYSDAELYSAITVESAERVPDATVVLWQPDEPLSVPPGTTLLEARFDKPAATINTPTFTRASHLNGADTTANITLTLAAANVQSAQISVASTATDMVYLSGLVVTGKPLVGAPSREEERSSATHGSNGAWWTARNTVRSRSVRGNAYIQTPSHAGSLALMLLHRSERPRLTYRIGGCPGKPGRRCGDRVTISDSTIMSANRDAFLIAIAWRLTRNGFTQDLEAIDAANLYPYTAYFAIGTNTLGASGGSTAPLFY